MKLKKIEIKKYRNLDNITIEFGDLTILIGRNDVGKSNIIKALDLFFNREESEDIKEISAGGSVNLTKWNIRLKNYRIFPNQKSKTIELTGYIELNNEEINKLFPYDKISIMGSGPLPRDETVNPIIISEKVTVKKGKNAAFEITSIKTPHISIYNSEKSEYLTNVGEGGYAYNSAQGSIVPILIELIKKKFLKTPAVRKLEVENSGSAKAMPNGKNMPNEFLQYEKEEPLEKEEIYNQINKDMTKLFPKYNRITSKTEDNGKKVNIHFGKFPSSSVGTGINQFFVNVFNLDSYENVIFGIEEPEIHLHPEAQREAFEFLKEQSEKKQIIMTTHSPIFTDCSEKTRLYLVKLNSNNITDIKCIEDKKEFKLIKYELGARNTDLFFYDFVILVEGDTEERALPIIIDSIEEDMYKLGIKQINIKGKDKLGKIKAFLQLLKDSGIESFVILDKGERVKGYIDDLNREGLIDKDNYFIWSKRMFVDCFKEKDVLRAMKNIYGEKFDMTAKQLSEERKKGNSTEKILDHYLYEKELGVLDKPALGEELALIIKQDINKGIKREETEPEKVTKKIISLVKKKA